MHNDTYPPSKNVHLKLISRSDQPHMIMGSKYVHKCKTGNSSHLHPIGWSFFWHTPTESDVGCIRLVGHCLKIILLSFLCRFTLHALSLFVAWLYLLELYISLINMCRKLVFIKSFCPCVVSFFLDLLETLQMCMITSFLHFLIIFICFWLYLHA